MNKIWIADAFTRTPYRGNPAAIMVVDEFFADARCQAIAAEMNLSETAFVKSLKDNHFHIRWFTPTVEVKLCGHATLAAAHILYEEQIAGAEPIVFDSLSGPLRVELQNGELVLDFPLQKTGSDLNKSDLAILSGMTNKIIAAVIAHDDVIVELDSETAVRNFVPDFLALKKINARGVIVTARGDKEFDFVSRFFAPRVGVDEDPVTGSAHCKLAHYWSEKLGKTKMVAYQASARGGEIGLEIHQDRVWLKGQVVTIMSGVWRA